MNELQNYFELIEEIITDFGLNPVKARQEQPGHYIITRGSAEVWIDVWNIPKEKRAYFQVMSPIMEVPPNKNNLELLKELLETNHRMYGVAFTIKQGMIYLKVIREARGLDKEEGKAMVSRVGYYADEYDDYLVNKYYPGSKEATS